MEELERAERANPYRYEYDPQRNYRQLTIQDAKRQIELYEKRMRDESDTSSKEYQKDLRDKKKWEDTLESLENQAELENLARQFADVNRRMEEYAVRERQRPGQGGFGENDQPGNPFDQQDQHIPFNDHNAFDIQQEPPEDQDLGQNEQVNQGLTPERRAAIIEALKRRAREDRRLTDKQRREHELLLRRLDRGSYEVARAQDAPKRRKDQAVSIFDKFYTKDPETGLYDIKKRSLYYSKPTVIKIIPGHVKVAKEAPPVLLAPSEVLKATKQIALQNGSLNAATPLINLRAAASVTAPAPKRAPRTKKAPPAKKLTGFDQIAKQNLMRQSGLISSTTESVAMHHAMSKKKKK